MSAEGKTLSHHVAGLLIVAAVAMACGRIVSAQFVLEPSVHRDEARRDDRRRAWPAARPRPMPTFGSNDRSRWATVASLVDRGTFVVGTRDRATVLQTAVLPLGLADPRMAAGLAHAGYYLRVQTDKGLIFEDGWQSTDKVLHPTTLEFYSSKPPMLSIALAGLYWLMKSLFGWSLTAQPELVVRTSLLLLHGLPFGLYLWQTWRLVDRWGTTEFGKLYVLAVAAFGTLVTPFLITLNNHTLATFCTLFAWMAGLRILGEGRTGLAHFAAAGLFGGLAACLDLPALSFAAALAALLLWAHPRRTLAVVLPIGLLLAAAFFLSNYAAVGQWQPAYSEFGGPWYEYEGSHWRRSPGEIRNSTLRWRAGEPLSEYLDRLANRHDELADGSTRHGIDWARYKESRLTYALHVLFGHHGLFSLTPVWFLSAAGVLWGLRRLREQAALPWFAAPLTLVVTLVVVGYYLGKSDNYGGWSNGLRWLMWMTPLWLTSLLPIADRLLTSRGGRLLAYALLGMSIASVHYQLWNPWRHPWIYDAMLTTGWPGY